MQLRALTLDDQATLQPLLTALHPQQSEFTFTNLFIWRNAYQVHLAEVDGATTLFSWRADPEDSFLFPPLGEAANAEVVRQGLAYLAAHGQAAVMARATAEDLNRLGLTGREFEIAPDRANWDYVYAVSDLIALSGNRYHRKRNHLEQFYAQHEAHYRRLTPELVPACLELQDRWCDEKHCDLAATLRAEHRAVAEVLEHFEPLRVTGGCMEINGRVEAFTLGELLNAETVVIHIEKAKAAFHGLYQVINQQFLEHEWSQIAYVNREQDLGVEGLRRAKESYHPHHFVEKFTVRLRA